MKEKHLFGVVMVTKQGNSPAEISFPEHRRLKVREAEDFWSDLLNAVLTARQLDYDPL